eukprot:203874-Rhodomonas_salina.1
MLIQSQRAVCFLLILLQLSCFDAAPGISFHEPQPGQTVSGRTFTISVGVSDFAFPSDGKGVLYLDGGKLIEVRQPQLTISMDGLGGLYEGQHTLRLVMYGTGGEEVGAGGTPSALLRIRDAIPHPDVGCAAPRRGEVPQGGRAGGDGWTVS